MHLYFKILVNVLDAPDKSPLSELGFAGVEDSRMQGTVL